MCVYAIVHNFRQPRIINSYSSHSHYSDPVNGHALMKEKSAKLRYYIEMRDDIKEILEDIRRL